MLVMTSFDVNNDAIAWHHERKGMRTTVNVDDELLARAKELTGISETASLVRYAVERLVEHEAARRLARLGGTMPDLDVPERQRRDV